MVDQVGRLDILSDRNQRREALSGCVQRLMEEGRTREQAEAICNDTADRQMGTRTLQTPQAPRLGV